MPHVTRLASIAMGLSLGVAACGGSGATVPPTQSVTTVPATASPAAPDESVPPVATAAPTQEGPGAGPLNTAVVTVGAERFEFTDVQCSIFAPRYIQAGNFGGDPQVSIVLPPEGWESQGDTFSPPSVTVEIGDDVTGQRWVAGDDGFPLLTPLAEGASEITSYIVPDGRPVTATGTASFVDVVAHNNGQDAPSVSGSFEVTCP